MSKEELNYYIKFLVDNDPNARYCAALYLEQAADKDSVPALIAVFGTEDNYLKGAAAKALAKIGPDAIAAVPALTEASNDEDSWVSTTAVYALEKIKGKKKKK